MRKLTHQELLQRQAELESGNKLPFCLVLNHIRSLYNVGSIFRTADGVGIRQIWLCGITGIPPDSKITKTALGAEKTVPWKYCRDPLECVRNLKKEGWRIVLLEQTDRSVPYNEYKPEGPVCLVIGNEIEGISDELLKICDAVLDIEMAGRKNSLNVAVAFGIAAYHIRQSLKTVPAISGFQTLSG